MVVRAALQVFEGSGYPESDAGVAAYPGNFYEAGLSAAGASSERRLPSHPPQDTVRHGGPLDSPDIVYVSIETARRDHDQAIVSLA